MQSSLEFRLIKPNKSATQAILPASPASDELTSSDLPQDFETALAQLEELVAKMESGVLPLEESLVAYRRGVALTRICQERLAQAEQQISVLEAGLLRPFDATDRQAE
jgi:exodeoxyribonuclease VII small subunit